MDYRRTKASQRVLILRTTCTNVQDLIGLSKKAHEQDVAFVR